MIDPIANGDELLSLEEAARLRCLRTTRGRCPHKNTLVRWTTRGVHGVRLSTIRGPAGGRFTTAGAVAEFLRQLNAGPEMATVGPSPCPDARRADAECDRIFGRAG